jgi:hypothetical protein
MVDLAVQLIKRQSAKYDPAELEDRYETRLRAMIDAKIAGVPLAEADIAPRGNVIDLVAALRKSVAEADKAGAGAAKRSPKIPLRTPVTSALLTSSSPVSLSIVAILIRLPVAGLIRLKWMDARSVRVLNIATGQETSAKRKWPRQIGRDAQWSWVRWI